MRSELASGTLNIAFRYFLFGKTGNSCVLRRNRHKDKNKRHGETDNSEERGQTDNDINTEKETAVTYLTDLCINNTHWRTFKTRI